MLFKNIANLLSFSRILVVPFFLLSFFYDNDVNFVNNNLFSKICAFVIVIYSAISDGLDGYYARKYNKITLIGKYLDPFADKVFNVTIFLSFLATGYASTWMVVVIYFREAGVESLRTLAANHGKVIASRWSGKWKTGIQMTGIMIILLNFIVGHLLPLWINNPFLFDLIWVQIPYVIMMVITTVTILSGFDYFYYYWHLFQQNNHS